jgi:hypothetical protein
MTDQIRTVQVLEMTPDSINELYPTGVHGGDPRDQLLAQPVIAEHLHQQVGEAANRDAFLLQDANELVVLLLSLADPDELIEQQVILVRWREPAQLKTRAVHDHLAQPPNLRGHRRHSHQGRA